MQKLYTVFKRELETEWKKAAARVEEKRAARRFLDGQITFLFPLDGASQMVGIVDANSSGLRLAGPEPLLPDSRHWLVIVYRGARRRFMVEIVWSRPVGDRHHAGARLMALDRVDRLHWSSYQRFIQARAAVA
ncbi:MAG: hypothetical protein ACYCW6_23320 [Candidatus Xenobia bacterium]